MRTRTDSTPEHGLPKSLGGADHPLNYRMIDSSLNRWRGNDVMRKLMTHPLHVLQGALVSALMRPALREILGFCLVSRTCRSDWLA